MPKLPPEGTFLCTGPAPSTNSCLNWETTGCCSERLHPPKTTSRRHPKQFPKVNLRDGTEPNIREKPEPGGERSLPHCSQCWRMELPPKATTTHAGSRAARVTPGKEGGKRKAFSCCPIPANLKAWEQPPGAQLGFFVAAANSRRNHSPFSTGPGPACHPRFSTATQDSEYIVSSGW